MKSLIIKLIGVGVILSGVAYAAEVSNVNPDQKGEKWIINKGLKLPSDDKLAPLIEKGKNKGNRTVNSTKRGTSADVLPARINNGEKIYMRPIFGQIGEGSSQASGLGYIFSYEINRVRHADGKKPENIYPPEWTSNFINEATGNDVDVFEGLAVAKDHGIPNSVDYGNQVGYNDFRWMSNYTVYKNALSNRVSDYYVKLIKNSDDLNELKKYLANHGEGSQDGGIVGFFAGFDPKMVKIPSGQYEEGKWIVKKFLPVNHMATIVGYDDNVGYDWNKDGIITNDVDINKDGKVDMSDWEKGALIMANSWGSSWGNGGFAYVPYRLWTLPGSNLWNGTIYLNVLADSSAKYVLKTKIEYNKRKRITIAAGISTTIGATKPEKIKKYRAFNNTVGNGGDLPFNGKDNEPVELALDMTELLSGIDLSKPYKVYLEIKEKDHNNTGFGKILSTEFIDYTEGSGKSTVSPYTNKEIVNNGTTIVEISIGSSTEIANQVPQAEISNNNIRIASGTTVVLDGSTSKDFDGTVVKYDWKQTSGPTVGMANQDMVKMSFKAPAVTEESVIEFALTVTDDKGGTGTCKAIVTVEADTGNIVEDGTINNNSGGSVTSDVVTVYKHIKYAGYSVGLGVGDYKKSVITAKGILDNDVSSIKVLPGYEVTIYDCDNFTGKSWKFTKDEANFVPLGLNDKMTSIKIKKVADAVNTPPISNAGADKSVDEGKVIVLDGSLSKDGDGLISKYEWRQTNGIGVTLVGASTSKVTFTAPEVVEDTVLGFELIVTDDKGATSKDAVNVTVKNKIVAPVNQIPAANAGADKIVDEGTTVALDGSSSKDADGSITKYEWRQVSGATVALIGATTSKVTFTAPEITADTILGFELTVTDDKGATSKDRVNVTVKNRAVAPVTLPIVKIVSKTTPTMGFVGVVMEITTTDANIKQAKVYAYTGSAGTDVNERATVAIPSVNTVVSSRVTLLESTTIIKIEYLNANGQVISQMDKAIDTVNPSTNQAPVANAGADQSVDEGTAVTLDGGASKDTDGSIAKYEWRQLSGAVAVLTGAGTSKVTFTAPEVTADTILGFELTVTDDKGATSKDTVNVTVKNKAVIVANQAPVANAGADQSVDEGTAVTLNGAASKDADGSIAKYEWKQTNGTEATLTGATTSKLTFTAPEVTADTILGFELTVTDDKGATSKDTVNVTVKNKATGGGIIPVVTIVSKTTPTMGFVGVVLEITTADPKIKQAKIYAYAGATVNERATITIPSVNTVVSSRVTLLESTTMIRIDYLDANGQVISQMDKTVDTLNPTPNQTPVSNAGPDKSIEEGTTVVLDGTASKDADGSITKYEWKQVSGALATLTGAATSKLTFVAPEVTANTILGFELTVTDDKGATSKDTVNVTVKNKAVIMSNQAPVSNAGPDKSVEEGTAVTLDGTASRDADGSIAKFEWKQTNGTAATLTGAGTSKLTFTAPEVTADTILGFELTVTDDKGATSKDTVNVTVKNKAVVPVTLPIVKIISKTTPTMGFVGVVMEITTADANIKQAKVYAYTGTTVNERATITIPSVNTVVSSRVTLLESTTMIKIEYLNANGQVISQMDKAVDAVNPTTNQAPVANAGADQSVDEGTAVTLNGAASKDADGTIAKYEWKQTNGTAATLTGAGTSKLTFTAPEVTADTILGFELTVTDDKGATSKDTVNVTVKNKAVVVANQAPVANAGVDQSVDEGMSVTLDGSASKDADGSISKYEWKQISGAVAVLTGAGTSKLTFIAPEVTADTILGFELTVTDDKGATSKDIVNVTVKNKAVVVTAPVVTIVSKTTPTMGFVGVVIEITTADPKIKQAKIFAYTGTDVNERVTINIPAANTVCSNRVTLLESTAKIRIDYLDESGVVVSTMDKSIQ